VFIERKKRGSLSQYSKECASIPTNICRHMVLIHRNHYCTWCTMTSTICTVGQCVNHCVAPFFDGSKCTTCKILTLRLSLDSQAIFSRWIWNTLQHLHDQPIVLSDAREISASARTNSSQHCVLIYTSTDRTEKLFCYYYTVRCLIPSMTSMMIINSSHVAAVTTAACEVRQLQCNIASLKQVQCVEIFNPRNKRIYTLYLSAEDAYLFILLKMTLKFHQIPNLNIH